ncbi:MAG: hypothetical protein EBX99_13480 [Acidimicrobiia bacterium]|nr:hypothetical protein [Acidimicrobiia bacterium]NDH48811.1 hypothetical protein [Acidimicrobiia bacterium]
MRWAVDEKVRLPVETVAEVNVPVFAAVPPIAGGDDRSSVPPSVRFPVEVTVPLSDIPLTVPVPLTDVTVPPLFEEAIVMLPLPFVMLILEPAVSVALLNVFPLELPIRS